jgi:hypothetical protein
VLLLAAYLVFTVGIAYFRDTRDAGAHVSRMSELARSLTHPGYEYDQLVFHGTDNDMFESLAAETIVVPSQLPISPLDFAYRTLAKPIPSRLWHGKPLAPEEELTHVMYPSETSRASSSSGLVGNLYQAGGAIGVAIGMALAGFLFRIPWAYWRRARESSAAQLLLAAFLMFVPILLRGAIGDTLARALFGIVPLLVAVRVCIRRHA